MVTKGNLRATNGIISFKIINIFFKIKIEFDLNSQTRLVIHQIMFRSLVGMFKTGTDNSTLESNEEYMEDPSRQSTEISLNIEDRAENVEINSTISQKDLVQTNIIQTEVVQPNVSLTEVIQTEVVQPNVSLTEVIQTEVVKSNNNKTNVSQTNSGLVINNQTNVSNQEKSFLSPKPKEPTKQATENTDSACLPDKIRKLRNSVQTLDEKINSIDKMTKMVQQQIMVLDEGILQPRFNNIEKDLSANFKKMEKYIDDALQPIAQQCADLTKCQSQIIESYHDISYQQSQLTETINLVIAYLDKISSRLNDQLKVAESEPVTQYDGY